MVDRIVLVKFEGELLKYWDNFCLCLKWNLYIVLVLMLLFIILKFFLLLMKLFVVLINVIKLFLLFEFLFIRVWKLLLYVFFKLSFCWFLKMI